MPVAPLLDVCLDRAALSIQRYSSLSGLPEELVLVLLELVLEKGKLNEHVLAMFKATEHEAVLARIQALRIRDPPPRFGGNDRWLHQTPGWY